MNQRGKFWPVEFVESGGGALPAVKDLTNQIDYCILVIFNKEIEETFLHNYYRNYSPKLLTEDIQFSWPRATNVFSITPPYLGSPILF